MKTLDVAPFREGLQRNRDKLKSLQQEMDAIRTGVQAVTDLGDSLAGSGGEAIKAFYRDCHLPLLNQFESFAGTFESVLTSIQYAQESLEPNASGYIREGFLESEVENGLTSMATISRNLTSDANGIMDSVADITALPHLDDSDVQQGIRNARKKKDNTVTDLNEFDSTQRNALVPVRDGLLRMGQWLGEIEGMFKDGITDVDFPAEEWKAYMEGHPMITGENICTVPFEADQEGALNWASVSKAIQSGADVVDKVGKGEGGMSAFALYVAGRKGGIKTTRAWDPKSQSYKYRINASKKALDTLRVPLDAQVEKMLTRGLPKDRSKWTPQQVAQYESRSVMLKYATRKPGQSGWSPTGEKVKTMHPDIEHFTGSATTVGQKGKVIGTATVKGTTGAFTDLWDVKGTADEFKRVKDPGMMNKASGVIRGTGKALGPIGAGLAYAGNYESATADGLSGGEAHKRAALDTAVDTAVGGAVQAGFTAAGTALIPIPGVGTAVGMAAGIGANWLLNKKFGDSDKSAMDHIKGWFR